MRAITSSKARANRLLEAMIVAAAALWILSYVEVSPVRAQQTVEPLIHTETSSKKPVSRKPHKLIRKEPAKKPPVAPAIPFTAYPKSMTSPAAVVAPITDSQAKEPVTQATSGTASVSVLQGSAATIQSSTFSSPTGVSTTAPTGTTTTATSGLIASAGTASIGNGVSRQLGRLMSEMPGLTQLTTPSAASPTTTSPVLGLSVTSLSFTAQQGGGNPAAQTMSITNTGGGTLTWSATDSAAWLTLSAASGTGNGSVTATVATGSLTAASYSATITISATGATTVSIPVTFTVTAASSTVTLSPTTLTFSAIQGAANPGNQSVTITSNGNWTATSNTSWLTVSPGSGSGNGSLTAGINLSAATVGVNTATITVTGGGITRTTTVTLTTTAASLTASPGSLTYTATQGAANPANQSITVSSNGSWTISDNASWLALNSTSGSNNATITASVNTANLTAGSHAASITLTGGGITRTISVTLTLNAPATSSATLTWNANTEPDLASYRIYRTTTPGVYGAALATVSLDTLTYLATGLEAGTTYYFTVRAVDSAGNESAPSNEVSKSIF